MILSSVDHSLMRSSTLPLLLLALICGELCAQPEQCDRQAAGNECAGGLMGGSSTDHYRTGCQSECSDGGSSGGAGSVDGDDLSSIISQSMFEKMLLHRNDAGCPSKGFYNYSAFIAAAQAFPSFGMVGDRTTRGREVAAFLAQTSHQTTGGSATSPDGAYSWGYCIVNQRDSQSDYCVENTQWPCAPGKKYYGRGPMQISYNYNYGPAGQAIGLDLLNNPDLVATDPVIAFKTALWFWTTPQPPKPSAHDAITEQWTPLSGDLVGGRFPGYGIITNIINGGAECGHGFDDRGRDRIDFYKRYCDILGVSYGANLNCYSQKPFG